MMTMMTMISAPNVKAMQMNALLIANSRYRRVKSTIDDQIGYSHTMTQEIDINPIAVPPPAVSRWHRLRRPLVLLIIFLLVLVVMLLICCFIGVFGGNVRVVWPGKVYR